MDQIYLDNSASAPPRKEVTALVAETMDRVYANPSSLHDLGLAAEKTLKEARRDVASLFRGREQEIIFTSGGTEANNLALTGTGQGRRQGRKRLIASAVEHPSVLNCLRHLEGDGYEIILLPVDAEGAVNPGHVEKMVDEQTILVSVMHVNNEVGTIQPLAAIGAALKHRNPATLFHVDAVQSFSRLPLDVEGWQADLVSCSGHKIHGPRGVGCLWIREGTRIAPLLHGGEQERGLRAGTENVAAAAGFALAAHLTGDRDRYKKDLQTLKMLFLDSLRKRSVAFRVNGPHPEAGAPHILNLSFPGFKAEVLLRALAEKGVFISAGSACHSRRPDPSHVLEAIALDRECLESALRFSFSALNSTAEAVAAAEITAQVIRELSAWFKP